MPNRLINEKIRTSKSINSLSDFNFRLWTYLITYVDDYGRGSADTELLKGFVFPRRAVREQDIQKGLEALERTGSILLYSVAGEPYFCFPNWGKYQRIQTKMSKYPEPSENDISRWLTVTHGDSPPKSNPIQSKSKSESEQRAPARDAFDEFWAVYPRKIGKGDARKSFGKVKVPVEMLIAAVERQKKSQQWTKDDGRYIPNPATWLNQGRWDDELEEKTGFTYDCGVVESL